MVLGFIKCLVKYFIVFLCNVLGNSHTSSPECQQASSSILKKCDEMNVSCTRRSSSPEVYTANPQKLVLGRPNQTAAAASCCESAMLWTYFPVTSVQLLQDVDHFRLRSTRRSRMWSQVVKTDKQVKRIARASWGKLQKIPKFFKVQQGSLIPLWRAQFIIVNRTLVVVIARLWPSS